MLRQCDAIDVTEFGLQVANERRDGDRPANDTVEQLLIVITRSVMVYVLA